MDETLVKKVVVFDVNNSRTEPTRRLPFGPNCICVDDAACLAQCQHPNPQRGKGELFTLGSVLVLVQFEKNLWFADRQCETNATG